MLTSNTWAPDAIARILIRSADIMEARGRCRVQLLCSGKVCADGAIGLALGYSEGDLYNQGMRMLGVIEDHPVTNALAAYLSNKYVKRSNALWWYNDSQRPVPNNDVEFTFDMVAEMRACANHLLTQINSDKASA